MEGHGRGWPPLRTEAPVQLLETMPRNSELGTPKESISKSSCLWSLGVKQILLRKDQKTSTNGIYNGVDKSPWRRLHWPIWSRYRHPRHCSATRLKDPIPAPERQLDVWEGDWESASQDWAIVEHHHACVDSPQLYLRMTLLYILKGSVQFTFVHVQKLAKPAGIQPESN